MLNILSLSYRDLQTEIIAAVLNESKPLVSAIIFKIPFSRVYIVKI